MAMLIMRHKVQRECDVGLMGAAGFAEYPQRTNACARGQTTVLIGVVWTGRDCAAHMRAVAADILTAVRVESAVDDSAQILHRAQCRMLTEPAVNHADPNPGAAGRIEMFDTASAVPPTQMLLGRR